MCSFHAFIQYNKFLEFAGMIQVKFLKMRYTSKRGRRDFMEFIREVNGRRLTLVADEDYQKEAEELLTFVGEYFEENWDEVDTLIPINY